jgi:hypothetical protein
MMQSGRVLMKTFALVIVLLGLSAVPVLALPSACATAACRPAPAPLLGAGIPSAIAIGGALLGAKFWRRKKK